MYIRIFVDHKNTIFIFWSVLCPVELGSSAVQGLKMLFVSCNPTVTGFYSKKYLFSALPNPNQHKTYIKNTFLNQKNNQKIIPPLILDQTTFPIFFGPLLYNWYFLQAFNFRYFRAPHDSAKITSFK